MVCNLDYNDKIPHILYEDRWIIVLDKPAYFPVQSSGAGKKDCCSFLKNHLYEITGKNDPYIGVIHRLDEPVQGILVFAVDKKSAAALSEMVRDGKFDKRYTAAVTTGTEPVFHEKKTLSDFIVREKGSNLSKIAKPGQKDAKRAELSYEIKDRIKTVSGDDLYIADIELYTGRHHQIRLQLMNAKMPIYGDRKYGGNFDADVPLCLCADRLEFKHPIDGRKMSFTTTPVFLEKITLKQ